MSISRLIVAHPRIYVLLSLVLALAFALLSEWGAQRYVHTQKRQALEHAAELMVLRIIGHTLDGNAMGSAMLLGLIDDTIKAVAAGALRLVGTDPALILAAARAVLSGAESWGDGGGTRIYGDGAASPRIVKACADFLRGRDA